MAHDIVLKGGIVVTTTGVIKGGVAIEGEKIVVVGADESLGAGKREIALNGQIVFPGLIDPHIHFGLSDRFGYDVMEADFQYDSKDCLVGGVTTVATTTLIGRESLLSAFDGALRCASGRSWCDFKVTCVVNFPEQVREIPAVVKKGGVSYKFFTGYAGKQAEVFGMNKDGISTGMFHEACKAIAQSGGSAFPAIHAEDPYVRGILVDEIRKMGRSDYLVAWAETTPAWAESVQIYTYALVANQFHIPVYPVHLSAAESVDTVAALQREGIPIVAETTSFFLSTTAHEMDAKGMGGKAKVQPGVRFERDRDRLWKGIREGTIKTVGTDGLTYSAQFKESEGFWDCRQGVNIQVTDTLALLYDEGVNRRRLDLPTVVQVVSENAAKILRLYPRKGAIVQGADADLVVLDPEKEAVLGKHRYRGRSDYSLWEGRKVKGLPVMTLLRGQVVMENGELTVDKPFGQHIR
jgi:dihydropyrimidinase